MARRMEYEINGHVSDFTTKGYPIDFPAPGRYAVRRVDRGVWVVDELSTGCRFARHDQEFGRSRAEAIELALSLWRAQGRKAILAVIAKWKRRRKKLGRPMTLNKGLAIPAAPEGD